MESKTVKLSFKKSFKSLNLWGSALMYHVLTLLPIYLAPGKTTQIVTDIFFNGPTKPETIPSLPGDIVPSISTPSEAKLLINILVFDLLFVVLFYIYEKSRHKLFNKKAIWSVILLSNLYFLLLFRYLLIRL